MDFKFTWGERGSRTPWLKTSGKFVVFKTTGDTALIHAGHHSYHIEVFLSARRDNPQKMPSRDQIIGAGKFEHPDGRIVSWKSDFGETPEELRPAIQEVFTKEIPLLVQEWEARSGIKTEKKVL